MRRSLLWYGLLSLAVLSVPSRANAGERQIRPFVGVTFEGATTFVFSETAAGKPHVMLGVNAVWLREIFGIDVDLAHAPGFFQDDDPRHLVLSSGVTTLTGNIVVAAPARKTEYGLRPYVVGGAGLMRVRIDHAFPGPLPVAKTYPAIDVGGGVLGFITNRIGVCWEVRRFTSLSRSTEQGLSIGAEQLSFWRASMALAIRY